MTAFAVADWMRGFARGGAWGAAMALVVVAVEVAPALLR